MLEPASAVPRYGEFQFTQRALFVKKVASLRPDDKWFLISRLIVNFLVGVGVEAHTESKKALVCFHCSE